MYLFSEETQKIVTSNTGIFTAANYSKEIEKRGGFSVWVKSLGGVFSDHPTKAETETDLRIIAEYVFGLMCIFRFAYYNGKTWWYYLNSNKKCFYSSKTTKGWRGGSIIQLCTGSDGRLRITNCNYGIDTLLMALGWYKYGCGDKRWLSNGGKKFTDKSKLKPGDLVHFYKNGTWHHVVMVYKIEGDKIWCFDFGNRFIKNGLPLHYMTVSGKTAGGEYGSDTFQCWHIVDLKKDENMSNVIIDVSEFQTDIDWAKVKKSGIKGAIIRIGLRGSVKSNPEYYGKIRYDKKYQDHLSGVLKNDIPFSVYFFPTSINDEEAAQEADWIIKNVDGLNLSFPVFLDSELVDNGNGRADKLSKEDRTHYLRTITDRLEAAGIPCGVYASRDWLTSRLDMSKLNESVRNNTWCAEWADKCNYSGVYSLWQYGKANINGAGKVDVSKQIKDFDMSVSKKEEKMYYRSVYVNKAKSFIGTKAGSANHKLIIDTYNSYTPHPRNYKVTYADAWCAAFVSSIAIMVKYTSIIPVECGCPQMIEKARSMGIWKESDSYKPLPGDLILYDWQDSGAGDNTGTPDHIGIVESCDGSNITVIEGNYNNSVMRRSLKVNGKYIRGFIVPKYTAAAPAESKKLSFSISLPELHPGDTGEPVKFWQFLAGVDQTGILDENQVKKWQKENGKKVDGWIGSGSWTKALKNKRFM